MNFLWEYENPERPGKWVKDKIINASSVAEAVEKIMNNTLYPPNEKWRHRITPKDPVGVILEYVPPSGGHWKKVYG